MSIYSLRQKTHKELQGLCRQVFKLRQATVSEPCCFLRSGPLHHSGGIKRSDLNSKLSVKTYPGSRTPAGASQPAWGSVISACLGPSHSPLVCHSNPPLGWDPSKDPVSEADLRAVQKLFYAPAGLGLALRSREVTSPSWHAVASFLWQPELWRRRESMFMTNDRKLNLLKPPLHRVC